MGLSGSGGVMRAATSGGPHVVRGFVERRNDMSETLPVTGAVSTLLTALGAGLVALGGFFVSFGRRLASR